MKKFLKTVVFLAIAAACIYFYDMYSGFQLTKSVSNIVSGKENVSQSVPSTVSENEKQAASNLNNQLYMSLSDEDKEIYNTIYNGLTEHKPAIFIKQFPEYEKVFEIISIVMSEHPEIFWTKGDCAYTGAGILMPEYFYSRAEARERQTLIEKRADEILAKASGDEYSRTLSFFEFVTLNTQYDRENVTKLNEVPHISTIEGVFLNNSAVCAGYAKAYQYLLQRSGISALCITGTASTPKGKESHAWVCHSINGKNYLSDPTWSDGYSNSAYDNFAGHDFFSITSGEMNQTHTPDSIFKSITADSTQYNYYIKEGLFFDSYDLAGIKQTIKKDVENGSTATEIKFSDNSLYNLAVRSLFEQGDIYDILKAVDPAETKIATDSLSYSTSDSQNTITIMYNR